MEPSHPGGEGATRAWQLVPVALSLGACAVFVFLPVALVVSLFTGGHLLEQGAPVLARMGALEQGVFTEVFHLSCAILLVGLCIATWRSLHELAPEAASPRPGFLERHPWLVLGALLCVANLLLVPRHGPSAVPGLAGAAVFATAGWVALTAIWAVARISKALLGVGWRLSRTSPFGAGVVAVGGFTSAALSFIGMLTLGFVTVLAALAAVPSRGEGQAPHCTGSGLECFRQVLVELSGAVRPPSLPTAGSSRLAAAFPVAANPAPAGAPQAPGEEGAQALALEDPQQVLRFEQCVKDFFERPDLAEVRQRARVVAAQVVGDMDDAKDIVQLTILSVCKRPRPPRNFSSYFLSSVRRQGLNWVRDSRSLKRCSLDTIPEPSCGWDSWDDEVTNEQFALVERAMCTLGEADRDLLRMRYSLEWSVPDISRYLGIEENATRQRLFRALKRLNDKVHQLCE